MAHRAAFYSVRVKVRNEDEFRRLGDLDEAGLRLDSVLLDFLGDDFETLSADETKLVRSVGVTADDDGDLLVTLQHGESGVASDIVDEDGAHQFRRTAKSRELVRCYSLFRLPEVQDTGWLVTHVSGNRGVKGLLETGLYRRFRETYPELMLQFTPFVRASTMEAAIEADRVDKVRLVKYEQPHDRAYASTNKWVGAGLYGKIELDVTARGTGQRVLSALLRDYVHQEPGAFDAIVEFEGMTFDEAKVEVVLPDGTHRTFNIEKPDSGHPMTLDLEGLVFDGDGEPSAESVFTGLRSALGSVG